MRGLPLLKPPYARISAIDLNKGEILWRIAHGETPDAVRNNPHIAFRVASLASHIEGQEILIPPFIVGDFLEVVFIKKHNTIFEYMHYLKEGWFGK